MTLCKSCGAEIEWIKTRSGKNHPINLPPINVWYIRIPEKTLSYIGLRDAKKVVGMYTQLKDPKEALAKPPLNILARDYIHAMNLRALCKDPMREDITAYSTHFETCPQADKHRGNQMTKRPETPIRYLTLEECDAGKNMSILEFFCELLAELWRQEDGFSGKRPFGNSGWKFPIYKTLIKEGLVKGKLDEYGCVEDVDTAKADAIILGVIQELAK